MANEEGTSGEPFDQGEAIAIGAPQADDKRRSWTDDNGAANRAEESVGLKLPQNKIPRNISVADLTSEMTDKYIRNLSKKATAEHELSFDEERLYRSVREAGEDSVDDHGAVEVWVLDEEETGMLFQPKGGWWNDPDMDSNEAIQQLVDCSHPKYKAVQPVMPGVDHAGILWAEAHAPSVSFRRASSARLTDEGEESQKGVNLGKNTGNSQTAPSAQSSTPHDAKSVESKTDASASSMAHPIHLFGAKHHEDTHRRYGKIHSWSRSFDSRAALRLTQSFDPRIALRLPGAFRASSRLISPRSHGHRGIPDESSQRDVLLIWRDLESLLYDPLTPNTDRMRLLLEAGFVKAAGVPFHISGHNGIVIFLSSATLGDAEPKDVSLAKHVHMIRSANVIGATIACLDARKAALSLARKSQIPPGQTTSAELESDSQTPADRWPHASKVVHKRIKVWAKKCLGGNLQIPPSMSWRQSFWTMLGVFIGLLTLSLINESVKAALAPEGLEIPLAPMGALMTLQYGLTAAPASQPRNAILGQVVAGGIAMAFIQIPGRLLPAWICQAVAPAIAISTLTKLGIVHPPAGASSVLLSSRLYGWATYLLLVFAAVVSIFPAVVVNNMSSKRQYPIHWSFFPTPSRWGVKVEKQDGVADALGKIA